MAATRGGFLPEPSPTGPHSKGTSWTNALPLSFTPQNVTISVPCCLWGALAAIYLGKKQSRRDVCVHASCVPAVTHAEGRTGMKTTVLEACGLRESPGPQSMSIKPEGYRAKGQQPE